VDLGFGRDVGCEGVPFCSIWECGLSECWSEENK